MIGCFGVGVDAIDLAAARAGGIKVSNTPDILTEAVADLGLALLLIAWERWRARPDWRPLAAMVVVQWLMVNTHQLFVVGMVLQLGFVAHLLVTRAVAGRGWVDDTDAALPLGPPVVALGARPMTTSSDPQA